MHSGYYFPPCFGSGGKKLPFYFISSSGEQSHFHFPDYLIQHQIKVPKASPICWHSFTCTRDTLLVMIFFCTITCFLRCGTEPEHVLTYFLSIAHPGLYWTPPYCSYPVADPFSNCTSFFSKLAQDPVTFSYLHCWQKVRKSFSVLFMVSLSVPRTSLELSNSIPKYVSIYEHNIVCRRKLWQPLSQYLLISINLVSFELPLSII